MSDQITVLEIWRADDGHSIYVFRGHLEESELKPFIKQWCKDMLDDPEPDPNDPATEWYYEVIQQEFFKPISRYINEEYTNDPAEDLYSGLLKDDIEVQLHKDGQEWLIDVKDHKTNNYVEGYVEELFTKAKERYDYLVKKYDQKEYPFKEGDDYWTIDNDNEYGEYRVVWSCWDDISEEMHDENPYQVYYRTEDEAKTALEEGTKKVYCTNGTLV